MSRSPAPTNAQLLTFAEIFDVGCIACRLRGLGWVAPEQDHRNRCDLAGHKRVDNAHDNTLGLCCWHHRGIPWEGWTAAACLEKAGPSKQLQKRKFLEVFGTIQELHDAQRQLLERMRATTTIRPRAR